MEAKSFDRKFDAGEKITEDLDLGRLDALAPMLSASTWIFRHGWCIPWIVKQGDSA